MESVGALGSPIGGSSNLLCLPAPCPWDEDEESLGLDGIKPKSSPTPRRRSSASSDDSLPPPSTSRRVSFADAFGLSLVSVKQFDAWGANAPSGPPESNLNEDKEYYMIPLYSLPQTSEELELRVHEQKLELESLELISGTTTLRGIIRVLNVCFDKMVYVRTSLDSWRSHFDLLAEYVPGLNNAEMDCFSFKVTLVPPFGEGGARVDFCLRYDTSLGTFWANNSEKNYSVVCCEKIKEKPQNESERRKSCLKITSPNVSASTTAETNNEEPPVVNISYGKSTDPESVNENSEKREKESKELVEEISRNRSRRSRRKAARLEKVKEHFAKREKEIKLGTKTEATEETSKQELEKTAFSPLSQQTPQLPTDTQISPLPAETLKSTEYIGDTNAVYSQAHPQPEEDTIINSSTAYTDLPLGESMSCDESIISSASEVLENIQLTEDQTDQNVSISQSLSICNKVERAWEHFEKDAKQRLKHLPLKSKMGDDENITNGNREDNVSLKTTNQETELFSHGFTFGTIVAPLYHQVFKSMEIEKKDFMQKKLQVDGSLKEMENQRLTVGTDPETTGIWPESCISSKETICGINVDDCNGSTDNNSKLTVNPTKNHLSESYKSKCSEDFQNPNDDILFTEANPSKATSWKQDTPPEKTSPTGTCLTELQEDSCPDMCLYPLSGPHYVDATNETTNSGIENLPDQIQPSLSLNFQIEMSQNQKDPTNFQTNEEVQTEDSISNSRVFDHSEDDPAMHQTSEVSFGDNFENDSCEMRLNIETPEELAMADLTEQCTKPENTQTINTSNTLQNSQMNDEKEQMLMTSEKKSSNSNDFDGEQNPFVIKEVEEIKKITNSESLEDEELGTGNQIEQKGDEEQEGGKDEYEDKLGIKSIEDELKYIDDDEDLDEMEPERENKQADVDDLLSLKRDSEEQKGFIDICNVHSTAKWNDDLNKTESLGGTEVLENKDRICLQICEETPKSLLESSQESDTEVSGSTQALESDWDLNEFIDKEENVFCESQTISYNDDNMEYQSEDSLTRDLENADDNTSTESQMDDDMELYLNSLRNSKQSVFRENAIGGNHGKRSSVSRRRPSMPSISESVDEDHPNSSQEDLTNISLIMELERATLPLVDGNERVIGRHVLWWKEFLSYDNMSRMAKYTFLMMVFLVAAYYYDFIACFALYLLTVYWLFHQGEGEPLKNSRKGGRRLQ